MVDAGSKVVGIGGSNSSLEKDKLRIVTTDKEITVCESHRVGNLGVNTDNNKRFWILNLMTKPNKPYDTTPRLDPSI